MHSTKRPSVSKSERPVRFEHPRLEGTITHEVAQRYLETNSGVVAMLLDDITHAAQLIEAMRELQPGEQIKVVKKC